ncbi:hypothetical protein HDU79_009727 [Rhizoclosmatium sp. JEL0117]|nr:hypothetical protein HDU79_009727 [Rhizoclosmatium sp. JEL0117]
MDVSKSVTFSSSRPPVPLSQHPFALFPIEVWRLICAWLGLGDSRRLFCAATAFRFVAADLVAAALRREPIRSLAEFAASNDVLALHKPVDDFVRRGLGPEPPRWTDVFAEWEGYDNTLDPLNLLDLRDEWLRKYGGAKGRSHSRDHAEWEGAYNRMTKELKRDLCILWTFYGKLFPFTKQENAAWKDAKLVRTGCLPRNTTSHSSAKKGIAIPTGREVSMRDSSSRSRERGRGERGDFDSDEEFDAETTPSKGSRKQRRNASQSTPTCSSARKGSMTSKQKRQSSRGSSRHSTGTRSAYDSENEDLNNSTKPPPSPAPRFSTSAPKQSFLIPSSNHSTTTAPPTSTSYTKSPSLRADHRSYSATSSTASSSTSLTVPSLDSPSTPMSSTASPYPYSHSNQSPHPKSILRKSVMNMRDIANLAPPFSLDSGNDVEDADTDCLDVLTTATTPKAGGTRPSTARQQTPVVVEASPFFEMDMEWGYGGGSCGGMSPMLTGNQSPVVQVENVATPPPLSRRQMRILKKQGGLGVLDVHPKYLVAVTSPRLGPTCSPAHDSMEKGKVVGMNNNGSDNSAGADLVSPTITLFEELKLE